MSETAAPSTAAAPAPGPATDLVSELLQRAGGHIGDTSQNLGLLADLPGNWRGHGFNLTARPAFGAATPFFLELNATHETLDFNAISGQIPNRGSLQQDLFLYGVRYLQQVTDVSTDTGIHIEPGIWLHVPASTLPPVPENYVRQSTIPHGDSLLAQSNFFTTVAGGPLINPVNTTPFTDATIPGLNSDPVNPITNPAYLQQYLTDALPAKGLPHGLDAAAVIKDPTLLLKNDIKNQTINQTVVISISTVAPGSLINIPFVAANANATQLDAIFWIEEVALPFGGTFLQLQYVQRVILDFVGIHWPHVSVATLKRL